MSKINKPYKCMYCGERYSTLSHVSICPCDKFSNIPPSENTDNKTVATGEQVGVVDSVGDALSQEFEQVLSCCDTCLDLPSFMRCKDACSLSKDDPQVSSVIGFDVSKSEEIDDSTCLCCTSSICEFKTSLYAESGIFSRAE